MKNQESKALAISGRSLCKTFKNGTVESHVIRNLDVEIYGGDFTVIMGNSGAGKSTLLHLLSGIDDLTSGEIHMNTGELTRMDNLGEGQMALLRRRHLGFVFQEPNLLEDFSVYENLALTGYLAEKNRSVVHDRVEALLDHVEMLDHANKYPNQLSGGQKQRVAIARGMINGPAILFADEPTGALNAGQSEAALDLLSRAHTGGQTVLMVTHDIKAATRGNRLLFMKDGKIDGELDMGPFEGLDPNLRKLREQVVFQFLQDRGW